MSLLPDRHTRALLLDAMGTLIYLEPPAPALRHELRTRLGVEVSAAQAEAAMRAEIAYYRAHMHGAADEAGVDRLRQDSARALRAALPSDRRLADAGIDELTAALVAALRFTAYPDAIEAIRRARRHDIGVAVVSNWDASLPQVLAAVGLAEGIDAVISSAVAGAAKPDPEIFRVALAAAGCGPAEALHVGDSFNEDILGARAAGIRALWLTRTPTSATRDAVVIPSLTELFASA